MGTIEQVLRFLSEYYIDTEYYLNWDARAQIQQGIITIQEIDKLPPNEMIEYLDVDLLVELEIDNINDANTFDF